MTAYRGEEVACPCCHHRFKVRPKGLGEFERWFDKDAQDIDFLYDLRSTGKAVIGEFKPAVDSVTTGQRISFEVLSGSYNIPCFAATDPTPDRTGDRYEDDYPTFVNWFEGGKMGPRKRTTIGELKAEINYRAS